MNEEIESYAPALNVRAAKGHLAATAGAVVVAV